MDSITDTIWDVVICGTGLQQSLLALALSRSGKNILHIDPNPYYGGADAVLNLAEVDKWAEARPVHASAERIDVSALGRQLAYSIPLAPQFLHARSALVGQLVSSRAFRQLEFLAISSFYVLDASSSLPSPPSLVRIPATREDVFATTAMSAKSKRQLMKFLKFVLAYDSAENEDDNGSGVSAAPSWKEHASTPLGGFLQSTFGLDDGLRDKVLALTLSLDGARVTVAEGLARLHRHMSSMGVFGAGFAGVYAKWGGCGEIVQVACRAAAVGGAIYMLGSGIQSVQFPDAAVAAATTGDGEGESETPLVAVELTQGMTVKTKLLVRGSDDVEADGTAPLSPPSEPQQRLSRLVALVGSPLPFLFAPTVEGAPVAGGAVIALPAGKPVRADGAVPEHPIFVMAHSSDTGECPSGQSVLHFTTIRTETSKATLDEALDVLLSVLGDEARGHGSDAAAAAAVPCLYKLHYEQPRHAEATPASTAGGPSCAVTFAPLPVDLTVQDAPLDAVREAWKRVVSPDAAEEAAYMVFGDREEGWADEDEYE